MPGTDVFDEAEKQQGDVFDQAAKTQTPDPLKTGAGMEAAAHQQATPKPGVLPEPKPSFLSRTGETLGITRGTDPVSDAASQLEEIRQHPISEFARGSRELAKAPARLAYGAITDPLGTSESILPVNRAISDARGGNYGAAAGDLVGGAANVYGLAKGARALPDVAEGAASALNRAGIPAPPPLSEVTRLPNGKLAPPVRTLARAAGAGAGGFIGGGPGAVAGTLLGPGLVDMVLPKRPAPFIPAAAEELAPVAAAPKKLPSTFNLAMERPETSGFVPRVAAPTPAEEFAARQAAAAPKPELPPAPALARTPKGVIATIDRPAGQGFVPRVAGPTPAEEFAERQAAARSALPPVSTGTPESVAGTRSLILTPSEAASEEVMKAIAKRRASERGMQFAGGMTPREGRKVPRLPTRMREEEMPPPRERIRFANE